MIFQVNCAFCGVFAGSRFASSSRQKSSRRRRRKERKERGKSRERRRSLKMKEAKQLAQPAGRQRANGHTKMPDGIINNQKCINYTY